MNYMKCSASAMALCPDRIICCDQAHPAEFAVGSECHRFNEEVENRPEPEKTIVPSGLEKIHGHICDEYCRFPRECECEDELMEHCESCPLAELLLGR